MSTVDGGLSGREVLKIGAVSDYEPVANTWTDSLIWLRRCLSRTEVAMMPQVIVNVVFLFDSPKIALDFTGVRSGSFIKKTSTQIVQAAVRPKLPVDGELVQSRIIEAVDLAEEVCRQKKRLEGNLEVTREVARRALSEWRSSLE